MKLISYVRVVAIAVLVGAGTHSICAAQRSVDVKLVNAPTGNEYKITATDLTQARVGGVAPAHSVVIKKSKIDGGYCVVTSAETYEDKQWREIVNALALKYSTRVIVYKESVLNVRLELAKTMPRYTCFVVRPEEAGRQFVTEVHRLTRKLDSDPYTDTIWGILTGYSAADAARIVATDSPLVLAKGAGGTGIALDKFDEGIWYDEGKKNHGMQKTLGGVAQDFQTPDDTTKSIVDTLNTFAPDYFQTSGHASERDWAPGYSFVNGKFCCSNGVLQGKDLAGNIYDVNSPNPKIYAPMGNCLIGRIPDKNCMALAWLGSGGAVQMMGYTVVTWFGYGGWGVGNYLFDQPGKFSFAESFYLSNQALLSKLNREYPARAGVEFDGWDAPDWGMAGYQAKLGADAQKDEMGLHWDRDTVAFYGDPAFRASLKPQKGAWEQSFTSNGDIYTFEIKASEDAGLGRPLVALFPSRLKMTRMLEGREFSPTITDNFIMLSTLEKIEKGKTYRVVFKAQNLSTKPSLKTTTHKKALAFLRDNMPDQDKMLSASFLADNVNLAYKAVSEVPWGKKIPDDIFMNYVLPYASVNERRDDWRRDFYDTFIAAAKSAKTPSDVAMMLNTAVFKEVGVVYHATKRPKPDQSPYESIEAGYASCTGLSVLLVDACRAVGVPARIVGIPKWVDGGNHNWVEIWDSGKWHALGAAEPGPLDQAWFMSKARATDKSAPEHRIYAVSFKKTSQPFPLVWAPSIKWVNALDVTKSYTASSKH